MELPLDPFLKMLAFLWSAVQRWRIQRPTLSRNATQGNSQRPLFRRSAFLLHRHLILRPRSRAGVNCGSSMRKTSPASESRPAVETPIPGLTPRPLRHEPGGGITIAPEVLYLNANSARSASGKRGVSKRVPVRTRAARHPGVQDRPSPPVRGADTSGKSRHASDERVKSGILPLLASRR